MRTNGIVDYFGQDVQVDRDGFMTGQFLGIDKDGAALIKTTHGIYPLSSGSNDQ